VIDPRFLNPWGLVTPRAGTAHGAGNDPLFHALYYARAKALGKKAEELEAGTLLCMAYPKYELKPGLVARRPPPDTLHQESFDNVFAWLSTGSKIIARRMLWYGFWHFGFFDTDKSGVKVFGFTLPKWEDWLWRYPHVWAIAVPTAFPCLAPVYRPYIRFISRFMNANHPSGWLLDWLWFERAVALKAGNPQGMDHFGWAYRESQAAFEFAARDQMDHDNPIITMEEV
jgi:hypothetical protein